MLDKRFNVAKSFHKKEKDASPLTDEQRYRQGYCEYNKGPGKYYWSWMAPSFLEILTGQSGHWVRDDSNASDNLIAGRDYADKVFELYKNHSWR